MPELTSGHYSSGDSNEYRIGRLEQDITNLEAELKLTQRELQTAQSGLQSQLAGLQVSLPLTYVARADLSDRLKILQDDVQRQLKVVDDTLRQLIFALIGALITGGLALLLAILQGLNNRATPAG